MCGMREESNDSIPHTKIINITHQPQLTPAFGHPAILLLLLPWLFHSLSTASGLGLSRGALLAHASWCHLDYAGHGKR